MNRLFVIIAVIVSLAVPSALAHAQDEKPQVLTEVQKLQLQNAAQAVEFWKQAVELWQLKAQQAASEFEKAREALQKLLMAVIPHGYQVNEKLELVKIPEATK